MELRKVQYPEIEHYHKFYHEYTHARNFVNLMKSQKKGTLYVDNMENPDFFHYEISGINMLAGNYKHRRLDHYLSNIRTNELVFYPRPEWEKPISEKWGEKALKRTRRHFDSSTLQMDHIRRLSKNIPQGYELIRIGLEEADNIDREIRPFISGSYGGSQGFVESGIGFCLKTNGRVASFAASYFPFTDYIEVHVETHADYKRKGLATIVAARLIEYCLQNDIEPGWDASHEISDRMAYNLGYSNPQSYSAYMIRE